MAKWEDDLRSVHIGRESTECGPMRSITVKLPYSVIEEIDARSINRSQFVRAAVADKIRSTERRRGI